MRSCARAVVLMHSLAVANCDLSTSEAATHTEGEMQRESFAPIARVGRLASYRLGSVRENAVRGSRHILYFLETAPSIKTHSINVSKHMAWCCSDLSTMARQPIVAKSMTGLLT